MKKQMKRLILTALLAGVSVGVPARTPGLPAADTVSGAMPAAPVSAPVAAASDTSGGERSEWLPSFTAVEVAAPVDIRFVQVPDTEAPRIIYDTKGSYTTRFRAEVRDRVLRITERRDARRPERTTVTVCYNTLERISVSLGRAFGGGALPDALRLHGRCRGSGTGDDVGAGERNLFGQCDAVGHRPVRS